MEDAVLKRSSGVLLHITSLPNGEGIGDLGESSRNFVDWLVTAKQGWWQVLPCGEIGYGESPYQSRSAYAGNPLLISIEALITEGLLDVDVLARMDTATTDIGRVDFSAVREFKEQALVEAAEQFELRASDSLKSLFKEFESAPEQHWLGDYARFVVLKQRFADLPWTQWPFEYVEREDLAIRELDMQEAAALRSIKLTQFFFAMQWRHLLEYAHSRGVRLLGDCPIYVAEDSADVWCNRELFDLNGDGTPRVVAGVPPDYFSETGQLWGNPLYLWERAKADNFGWWRARLKHCAGQFDLTRIDHFRGLEAYWEVPGNALDASGGVWKEGPGDEFLVALQEDYEDLPLVAEDLGDLTEEVHLLREKFELPGMRVLQFGFDGNSENPHAPHQIAEDAICYAGTHDNNTTLGWIRELSREQYSSLCEQLGGISDDSSNEEVLEVILNLALASPARLAVLTMQDLLHLPETARFNTPGTVGGNWGWRLRNNELTEGLAESLALLCQEHSRCLGDANGEFAESTNSLQTKMDTAVSG